MCGRFIISLVIGLYERLCPGFPVPKLQVDMDYFI